MARNTRRSAARGADSTLATPTTTTTATPVASAESSSKGADTDTPVTSDLDEVAEVKPTKKRAPVKRVVSAGKRKVQAESDDEESGAGNAESDEEEERPARRAPKRRAVGNKAYVEIPATARVNRANGKGKGKGKGKKVGAFRFPLTSNMVELNSIHNCIG
jgi:hypothetical protein